MLICYDFRHTCSWLKVELFCFEGSLLTLGKLRQENVIIILCDEVGGFTGSRGRTRRCADVVQGTKDSREGIPAVLRPPHPPQGASAAGVCPRRHPGQRTYSQGDTHSGRCLAPDRARRAGTELTALRTGVGSELAGAGGRWPVCERQRTVWLLLLVKCFPNNSQLPPGRGSGPLGDICLFAGSFLCSPAATPPMRRNLGS